MLGLKIILRDLFRELEGLRGARAAVGVVFSLIEYIDFVLLSPVGVEFGSAAGAACFPSTTKIASFKNRPDISLSLKSQIGGINKKMAHQ